MRRSKYGIRREDFPDQKTYNAAFQRAFRKTDAGKGHTRRMNLRAKGITPDRYDEMLAAQAGSCAVCGTTDPGANQHGPQEFCVDHDRACCPGLRSCGRCVCGLLCPRCNRAEGLLAGNAQALADYLRKHKQELCTT